MVVANRNGESVTVWVWRSLLIVLRVVVSRRRVNGAPRFLSAAPPFGSSLGSRRFILAVRLALLGVSSGVVLGGHSAVGRDVPSLVTVITNN